MEDSMAGRRPYLNKNLNFDLTTALGKRISQLEKGVKKGEQMSEVKAYSKGGYEDLKFDQ